MNARPDLSPLALTPATAAALRAVARTKLLDAAGVNRACGDSSSTLDNLCRRGLVKTQTSTRRDGKPSALYSVTRKGTTALDRYDAQNAPPPAFQPTWHGKTYSCPELGRTCQRPGAYDAFALPSLFGNERRMPKGAV